jgi:hypothetical protein
MRSFVTLVVAMLAAGPAAHAQQANQLPYPEGSYAVDPALCRMSARAIFRRYGDEIHTRVRNVRGQILDSYEATCEIRSVTVAGNNITIQAMCSGEGETYPRTETWVRVNQRSFRVDNRTFVSCGRFIR